MFKPISSPGGDSGRFIRLKVDGDSVKGVFRGEPLVYRTHWVQLPEGTRSVVCSGKPDCPHCMAGNKSKFRWRANMVVEENGMFSAKIFEGGKSTYDVLAENGSDYDLSQTLLKITRKGAGLDTTYSVLIAPPTAQLKPDALATIAKVTLLDLDPQKDYATPSDTGFAPADAMSF